MPRLQVKVLGLVTLAASIDKTLPVTETLGFGTISGDELPAQWKETSPFQDSLIARLKVTEIDLAADDPNNGPRNGSTCVT